MNCSVQSTVPQRRSQPHPPKPHLPTRSPLLTLLPEAHQLARRKMLTGDKTERHTSRHVTERHTDAPHPQVCTHTGTHTGMCSAPPNQQATMPPQDKAQEHPKARPQSPASLLVPVDPTCLEEKLPSPFCPSPPAPGSVTSSQQPSCFLLWPG